jgi:hypothetical protein
VRGGQDDRQVAGWIVISSPAGRVVAAAAAAVPDGAVVADG